MLKKRHGVCHITLRKLRKRIEEDMKTASALSALCCAILMVFMAPTKTSAFMVFGTPEKPYTWKTANGTKVLWEVNSGAPAMVRDAMIAATANWSSATNGTVQFAEGSGGITIEWDADGKLIADPLYLAYTTFNANYQEIRSARIIINASRYTWQRGGYGGVSTQAGKSEANLDSVILHELGHALGLDHSDRNTATIVGAVSYGNLPTMNSVVYAGAESLHQDDQARARSLYPSDAPIESIQQSETAGSKTPLLITLPKSKGRASFRARLKVSGGSGPVTWNFGDGSTRTGSRSSANHVFVTPGIYTVTATCGQQSGEVKIEVEARNSRR